MMTSVDVVPPVISWLHNYGYLNRSMPASNRDVGTIAYMHMRECSFFVETGIRCVVHPDIRVRLPGRFRLKLEREMSKSKMSVYLSWSAYSLELLDASSVYLSPGTPSSGGTGRASEGTPRKSAAMTDVTMAVHSWLCRRQAIICECILRYQKISH